MCAPGNTDVIFLPPDGKGVDVDHCIVPIVWALNAAGCPTIASCCGHGETVGSVILKDGRELVIMNYRQARAVEALVGRDIHGNELPAGPS